MEVPRKFPFPTDFPFRDDERSGLESLFQRLFFDRPFSPDAQRALARTRVSLAPLVAEGGRAAGGAKRAARPAEDRAGGAPSPAAGGARAAEAGLLGADGPRYVLLYRGESGIGKTRVFHRFRESARQLGVSVYEVYNHDVEGIPFKPFLRAIREILRDHDRSSALREKYRYGLERLMPELFAEDDSGSGDMKAEAAAEASGEAAPEPTAGPEGQGSGAAGASPAEGASATQTADASQPTEPVPSPDPPEPQVGCLEDYGPFLSCSWVDAEKVRIFDAITQLLLELTAQRPLVLVVHDLHWSDHPTIELLSYIGRNLALRNAELSPFTPRQLVSDPAFRESVGTGPEVEGFESEEWRGLSRKGLQSLDVVGAIGPISRTRTNGRSPGTRPGASAESDRGGRHSFGSRLMIVANYRGFQDPSHYMEQAIRELGAEPFAYHGEIQALGKEDTALFVRKSIEGVEVDGRPLELEPGAEDVLFEVSEGFPSFLHEIFRALLLREGSLGSSQGPSMVWRSEEIRMAVASAVSPAPHIPGAPAAGQPEAPAGQPAAGNSASRYPPPPIPDVFTPGRRHGILRLRLRSSGPLELKVLQTMAVAMRPVTPLVVSRAIGPMPGSASGEGDAASASQRALDAVLEALGALEARGIVEHYDSNACGAGAGDAFYFFRLWDYVPIVEETLSPAEKGALHARIGAASKARLQAEGNEVAYEVYYHYRRGPEPRACLHYGLLAAARFARYFALEKARRVYSSIAGLLVEPHDLALRVDVLEQCARISLALKDSATAEDLLRKAQGDAATLSPEVRVRLIILEAESAGASDANRALKILGRASRVLKDENTLGGVRMQLATARVQLQRQDLKRAINFGLKGISLCQKVGDVPELGELHRVLAAAFYRRGEYGYAVDNYQRALEVFERLNLRDLLVRALDELWRVYLERGNYFRAARYLYRSLEVRRKQHDVVGLCKSYDELGQVYLRSGDYLKTIENLNRTLVLKERTGDVAGINPTLVVLGDLYFRLGRYEQALLYFKREVDSSQRLGDTRGLVEAFTQLGRVHFELGDVKQAESLSKQVAILSTEFKLRSQEADGALLEGNIKALARDWVAAEKCFKLAAEVHGKLGHRRRELCAMLDLAEVKFQRELYDESLKHASKAQIVADEVKAADLQVRALTIKGNIHRFLKGGNNQKVRELLQKALELSQGLSDVHPLFQLYYSLAKVCHSNREYAEASNYYGKAEFLLKQIGEGLSDDRAVRYFEDGRRKIFADDVSRFRKEALGRSAGALADLRDTGTVVVGTKERQIGFADYKDLTGRVLRLHSELNQLHFHECLLAEALELAGADRGFVLRVQNRQYFPVSFQGFGKKPVQDPEFLTASGILQESIRKGRSWVSSIPEGEKEEKGDRQDRRIQLAGLIHRSILAVPFVTDERIFGGVYLDKPAATGQFVMRDQLLLEAFAEHAAVAMKNRREYETAIRDPLTGYYTPSYFTERLREAYRWFNLHGKSFTLLGYYLPTLEETLGDERVHLVGELTRELSEVLPHNAAICWGSPILYVLLGEFELPFAEALAQRIQERLSRCVNEEVPVQVMPVHARYQQGSEMYFEVRRRLLPEVYDPKLLSELRALLDEGVSLREAKMLLERHKIESTLRKTGGNITHAARELGIHRPQLSNLLKKHALRREVFEGGTEEDSSEASPAGPAK